MERWVLAFVLATAGMLAAAPLAADDYPSRPIRFLQGFAPGGNADVVTRVLGEERAIAAPHVDKRLRDLGAFPVSSTPEAAADRTKAEIARWNRVIDTAGIARQ